MKIPAKNLPARTITVALSNMLTQWACRLEQHHFDEILKSISPDLKGVRVLPQVVSDINCVTSIDSGVQTQNFDIAVWNYNAFQLSNFYRDYPRWKKTQQAVIINNAAKKVGGSHHLPLKTWAVPASVGVMPTSNVDLPFLPKAKYILRPEDGARCMGQIVVDTAVIDLHHALTKFKDNWFDKDFEPPEGVLVHAGFERAAGEASGNFKEGFFIQKLVEDVEDEYRLIVGPQGKLTHVLKRPRDHVGNGDIDFKAVISLQDELIYEQNNPGNDEVDKVAHALGMTLTVTREIMETIEKMEIPCNSVDLFIRASDGGYQWGFFEFCNQFSVADWPEDAVLEMAKSWYKDLLTKYFEHLASQS